MLEHLWNWLRGRGWHDWSDWTIRPRLIGTRVPWLFWHSHCRRDRCQANRKRWFPVIIPASARIPHGIDEAISVDAYLQRLRFTPPDPESLPNSRGMPTMA